LVLVDSNGNHLNTPFRFAITGGTDAYVNAGGQITEGQRGAEKTLVEIEL
jgi:hypothetical protein